MAVRPPLIQDISWPGVVAVESLHYTCSHGISPGIAILTTYPQTGTIASFGDLSFSDGTNRVTLKDCRVSRLTGNGGSEGQTWTLEIQDRRWRWPGLGSVGGSYNQLDSRGKLKPWSIRSPKELAKICLDAMGETNALVILPDGLPRAAGADTNNYLKLGENFASSLTNPPVNWDHTPPAEALARLADEYSFRVVFQPIQNRLLVTPLGQGAPLPDGPCESLTNGVDNPRVPRAIGIAGAPVRIQSRFLLEAVGEEWNGAYLPIDDLSYAPKVPAQVQVSTATFTGTGNPSVLTVVVSGKVAQVNGFSPTFTATSATSGTVAGKLTALAAQINAYADLQPILSAAATATVLTLTGKDGGIVFGLAASAFGLTTPPDKFEAALVAPAGPGNGRSWRYCPPPTFPSVTQTNKLSITQAQDLARKSVYKMYRVLLIDPHTGTAPMRLPWYQGPIVRRQQILLEQTKVEQVVPAPRIPGAGNKNNPGNGLIPLPGLLAGVLPEFYNGYSRDQAATCTGSMFKFRAGTVTWDFKGEWNTGIGDRVFVGFSIDPVEQIVIFNDHVYTIPNGGLAILPSSLTLETSCMVTDAVTDAVVRWEDVRPLGGPAPDEWQHHEDVQVGIVGNYFDDVNPGGVRNALIGWNYATGDFADAKGRAKYYLDGMQARYQVPQSDCRQYVGIAAIDPDGLTQQISWSFGGAGPTTRVSQNSEFSVSVPPYYTRRRAENLPPNAAAAMANQLEAARRPVPDLRPIVPQAGFARLAAMGGAAAGSLLLVSVFLLEKVEKWLRG